MVGKPNGKSCSRENNIKKYLKELRCAIAKLIHLPKYGVHFCENGNEHLGFT
jgi:hypothetical protein